MPNTSDFQRWLRDADLICVRRTGVDLDSLGDGPSWDAWHDGVSPADYVADRMADAGFPDDQAAPLPGARRSTTLARTTDAVRTRRLTGRMPILY